MRQMPTLQNIDRLIARAGQTQTQAKNGAYVEARPVPWRNFRRRFKLAWGVFTGRWDALEWTDQP